ncbi:hypothetical protein GQ457_15G025080 [Hibiscus cannabinus]
MEATKHGVRGEKGDVAEKAKNDDKIAEKAKADNGNKEVISLFVENLPEKLHWKGLWFSFARHGEVVSVYIAKKKSRGGKRFGFVRMKNLGEAKRVMERLDGFSLYGSRLSVKRAKENFEWERKRVLKPSVYKIGPQWSGKREEHIDGGFPSGSCQVCIGSMEEKMRIKRISGHVESEDLWRLRSDEGLEKGGDSKAVDLKEINEENGNVCIDSFHEDSGGELGLNVGHLSMVGPELNRKEVDLVDTSKVELDLGMEVIKDGGFCVSPLVKNLTWADKVKLNAGIDGLRDSPVVGVSDVVLEEGLVEKCEDFKVRRRKGKGRKFGSLLDLQNQSISDTERKRRDIALKKKNWSKESLEETELSGRSLSDSDINNRVSRIIKEAKQVLKLGEKIGVKGRVTESVLLCCFELLVSLGHSSDSEVKKSDVDVLFVRRLWRDDDFQFCFSAAVGCAGGLLSVWDSNCFKAAASWVHRNYILVKGVWIKDNSEFVIGNVYAPCKLQDQAALWDELRKLKLSLTHFWLVGGDFNVVRSIEDRLECHGSVAGSTMFNRFIEDCELVDLPLLGKKFTWFGPNGKRSRLDRFLLDIGLVSITSEWIQEGLKRSVSDHVPVLLYNSTIDWGPRPFKFVNCWLSLKEGRELISPLRIAWLISVAAALWTIWLARNEAIFKKTSTPLKEMLFLAKLRALMWCKASDNTCFVNEGEWWTCPFDCFFSRSSPPLGVSIGDATPVFRIQGVRTGDKATCGGLLFLQRPWGIAKHIAEIDSLICGCANVQFKSAENSNMAMVGSLAYDGLSRSTWLVAWW